MTFPAYLCPPICEQNRMSARLCVACSASMACNRRAISACLSSSNTMSLSVGSSSSGGPDKDGSSTWSWTSQPSRSKANVRATVEKRARSVSELETLAPVEKRTETGDVPCSSFGAEIAQRLSRRLCEPRPGGKGESSVSSRHYGRSEGAAHRGG